MNIVYYKNSKSILDIEISKEVIIDSFNPSKITNNTIEKYNDELEKVKEPLLGYINEINEEVVIKEIKKHKVYSNLVKVVGNENSKKLIQIGIAAISFVAINGVNVLANTDITDAAKAFDSKMSEVFVLIAVIGGWFLVMAAAIQIGQSVSKGNKEGIIGIVAKFIIIYISMLLMPTIIKFTRKMVLGW